MNGAVVVLFHVFQVFSMVVGITVMSEVVEYKSWVCLICGWIYNEAEGLPDDGIPAGTRFADLPADWRCPLCDVGKDDFVAVEF